MFTFILMMLLGGLIGGGLVLLVEYLSINAYVRQYRKYNKGAKEVHVPTGRGTVVTNNK